MLNNSISNAAFQCNQHTLSWASLLEKVTCSQLGAETAALHDITVPLERSLKKAPWYLISVTVTMSLMWSSQNCLSKMHLIHYTWGLMSTRLGAGDMQRWNQHRKKKKHSRSLSSCVMMRKVSRVSESLEIWALAVNLPLQLRPLSSQNLNFPICKWGSANPPIFSGSKASPLGASPVEWGWTHWK